MRVIEFPQYVCDGVRMTLGPPIQMRFGFTKTPCSIPNVDPIDENPLIIEVVFDDPSLQSVFSLGAVYSLAEIRDRQKIQWKGFRPSGFKQDTQTERASIELLAAVIEQNGGSVRVNPRLSRGATVITRRDCPDGSIVFSAYHEDRPVSEHKSWTAPRVNVADVDAEG